MGHFRKWGISCPPVWNGIFALKVTLGPRRVSSFRHPPETILILLNHVLAKHANPNGYWGGQ
jgi:hypothetical protein